jgi:hypothetical protein
MISGRACVGIYGASTGGRLKLAHIVMQSRRANRRNVGLGTGRGVTGEKSLVKCASFHRHRDRFAKEVAANLAVPCVVEGAGVL